MGKTVASVTVLGSVAILQVGLPKFCVYCYTFDYSEEHVHDRLLQLLGFVPEATKIRKVRLVAPSKMMYCVEFAYLWESEKSRDEPTPRAMAR